MSLPALSVRRPVTTAMVFLGLGLVGLLSWTKLPVELFPSVEYPQLTVVTRYPAAAPEEIESLVTSVVEEAVASAPRVQRVRSVSKEGVSLVTAECAWGSAVESVALGIREKLELVKERLPHDAEEPLVLKYNPLERPLLILSVTSTTPLTQSNDFIRRTLKEQLTKVDGVGRVAIAGLQEPEVLIAVDQARLSATNRSLLDVVDSLRMTNLNYPAGTIKQGSYEYVIRTLGAYADVPAVARTIVQPSPSSAAHRAPPPEARVTEDGEVVTFGTTARTPATPRLLHVGDVAEVADTFREPDSFARLNGQPQVLISVTKQSGANTIRVARGIRHALQRLRPELARHQLTVTILEDQSRFIQSAISGVVQSACVGGLLAFGMLVWGLRSVWMALIVSVSIPVAVLLAVIGMYACGLSLNVISLGGLALGIGMLVDNAIVVVEAVQQERKWVVGGGKWGRKLDVGSGVSAPQATDPTSHFSPPNPPPTSHYPLPAVHYSLPDAAIRGAERVFGAINASTLTTIIVFLPVIFVGGVAGALFRELAFTVTASLLASLLVALSLVPQLLAQYGAATTTSPPARLLAWEARYRHALTWCLAHRRLVLTRVGQAFVVGSLLMVLLPKTFFPSSASNTVVLHLTLPVGSTLETTNTAAGAVEQALQRIRSVRQVITRVGATAHPEDGVIEALGPHEAEFTVTARSAGTATHLLPRLLRQLPPETVQGGTLRVETATGPLEATLGTGGQFIVALTGREWTSLTAAAPRVDAAMRQLRGLTNVHSDLEPSAPETTVRVIKDRALAFGLTVRDIAETAQTALTGTVATQLQQAGHERDIRVVLRPQDRHEITRVGELLVASPLGMLIPLKDVAVIQQGAGPSTITRVEKARTITLTAARRGRSAAALQHALRVQVTHLQPLLPSDVRLVFGGETAAVQQSFVGLLGALLLALLFVYMVMAAQFETLWQPLLVMGTIPLGLIGVAAALAITWTAVSVPVLLGCIILGGTVVNNGILLIDETNQTQQREGCALAEAVQRAAQSRFQPILLTTGTTILGLIPLALGFGQGVALRAPMALTVMGGLTGSTILTLVVLPILLLEGQAWLTARRGALRQRLTPLVTRWEGRFRTTVAPVWQRLMTATAAEDADGNGKLPHEEPTDGS